LNPRRLRIETLIAIYESQRAEHGGTRGPTPGLRCREALLAVVRVPEVRVACPKVTAAFYAIEIVRGRPFIDGNKRVAFVALLTALELNGMRLNIGWKYDCVERIGELAKSPPDERKFVSWVYDQVEHLS